MKTASLREQVVTGVAWAAATRLAGQMLNWAMTLWVIRLLDPTDYGLMALTTAMVGFLQTMSFAGFADALVQTRDLDERARRAAFGIVILLNLGFVVVLCAAAGPLASFYHDPRLAPLLRVASITFVLIALGCIPRAMLDRALALKDSSRIDMLGGVIGGAATLALAWRGLGVWSLLAGNLIAQAVKTTGYHVLAPYGRLPLFSLRGYGHLLRFGGYRTAELLLWYATTQVDVVLTGRLLGSSGLGIYSVARTVAMLPASKLALVVRPVGLPAFAQLQGDSAQAIFCLTKSMRLISFLAFPVFLGMAAAAPAIVQAVLGPTWTAVSTPLAILALSAALRPAGMLIAPFLLSLGRVRASLANTALGLVLFTVAYAVGSRWGVRGVCIGAAVAYPVQFLVFMHQVSAVRGNALRLLLAPLVRPLLCAAIMGAVIIAVGWGIESRMAPQIALATLVGAGMVSYALAAALFCRQLIEELASMIGLRWPLPRGISPGTAG